MVTYLRDNRAGSSGHQAPKIGCLNRADNGGYRYAQDLIAEWLRQTPMSLFVPLLEFNLYDRTKDEITLSEVERIRL